MLFVSESSKTHKYILSKMESYRLLKQVVYIVTTDS
jgi:hypothetical protein